VGGSGPIHRTCPTEAALTPLLSGHSWQEAPKSCPHCIITLCPSDRPPRISHYVQCCALTTRMLSPLVASASCLGRQICQLTSRPRLREGHIPTISKLIPLLWKMQKLLCRKPVLRKYHNKCERHFLSLEFIIRNKERHKRPSGFLRSCSNLPQPTAASHAAAHAPLNYSLIFCMIALRASNQWI